MNPTIVYICMTLAGGQEFRDTPCLPATPTKPPLVGTVVVLFAVG
jgi:hypothetical protein